MYLGPHPGLRVTWAPHDLPPEKGVPMASPVTDEDLMARLRTLGSQVDPVPDDVVMAGRSALAYRDLDVRLAELVDEPTMAGAGTRGAAEDSWFTFEVDDVVIEVAVRVRAGEQHLVGQVDGGDVARLAVRQATETTALDVDELGRFSTPLAAGPVSVIVELVGGPRIATSWIVAPRQ